MGVLMARDLLVDDQEILQKGVEIQRCCAQMDMILQLYMNRLCFTRAAALISGKTSDKLQTVIELLKSLRSALDTIGIAGKICCDGFIRDVEDRDKFSF